MKERTHTPPPQHQRFKVGKDKRKKYDPRQYDGSEQYVYQN